MYHGQARPIRYGRGDIRIALMAYRYSTRPRDEMSVAPDAVGGHEPQGEPCRSEQVYEMLMYHGMPARSGMGGEILELH
jgi:hypothetical protein